MTKVGLQIINRWFKEFKSGFVFMQRKIRDQLAVRFSKVDVLENFWSKLLNQMMLKASKLRDNKMIQICQQILSVSPEI